MPWPTSIGSAGGWSSATPGSFLHRELGLSKAASFFRKTAAELIQRFPEIVAPLRDGRLCLITMASLAKVLSPENRAEVLPRFFHRSGLEAKAIAAELYPAVAPPIRTVVTITPASSAVASSSGEPLCLGGTTAGPGPAPRLPARRVEVEPLTPTRTCLHLTVSPAFLEKLEAARLALSHSMPGAPAEDVLSAGLDLLLERDAKRKGLVEKPRPAPSDGDALPGAVHIPAAVRREVWRRDGGRCQWPTHTGGICGSRLRLQLDHLVPRAQGCTPIPTNLRVLCAHHNLLAARQRMGDQLMDRYCRDPRQGELLGTGAGTG
jgi:hypothetical protein